MDDPANAMQSPSNGSPAAASPRIPLASGPDVQPSVEDSSRIPDHELLRPIASGAYGEVWLARNVVGTFRAVKVVRRDRHESTESFEREFKGLQHFEPVSRSHAGLVDILTLGLLPDRLGFYYVMELADDASAERAALDPEALPHRYTPRTLRADLKARGALPAEEVIALGLKLTSALQHLHERGLVHRDVKPNNILFISGQPKLADAGLVAAMDDSRSLVGTAGYIAPEGPGTPQGDVYALGKVLYEAAFGKDRKEFPSLPADVASRPDHACLLELNEVIGRACGHNPAHRYAGVDAMRADLELLQLGQSAARKHFRRRCVKTLIRCASMVAVLALLYVCAKPFLLSSQPVEELRSTNPEVNRLVDKGNFFLLNESPESVRRALESFSRAVELDPSFVPAHYGIYNAVMNDPESRRAVAATLMNLAPESAEARIAHEHVMWNDWRFKEALEGAQITTKRRAFSKLARARSFMAYGYMLVHSGYPQEALKQYRMAAELSGADSQIERHLGHPYFAQRQFHEALKHYDQSVALQPNHHVGHYWRGRALEELGDFENAINAFETAEIARGQNETATRSRFDRLREAYRHRQAEGYWSQRLDHAMAETTPNLYEIASLHARLGRKTTAYEFLEKACEQRAFVQGLLFDASWDQTDPRLREIARRIGLLR